MLNVEQTSPVVMIRSTRLDLDTLVIAGYTEMQGDGCVLVNLGDLTEKLSDHDYPRSELADDIISKIIDKIDNDVNFLYLYY